MWKLFSIIFHNKKLQPMKLNLFKTAVLLSFTLILFSCLGDSDDVELSSDPSFVSLTFAKNSVIADLESAEFTLEYSEEFSDSIIVNLDSLPYNTRIDSVFPTFKFKSSYNTVVYLRNDTTNVLDSVYLTGTDTLDFNYVVKVKNIPADQSEPRVYHIKVNVHQVEPELYVWTKLRNNIFSHEGSMQKAVFFDNKFQYFVNSGVNLYLYTSTDATSWNSESTTGLPITIDLKSMVEFNNKLFALTEDGKKIYSSTNGTNWSVAKDLSTENYTIENFLYVFNNQLWAITLLNADNSYHFTTSNDGISYNIHGEVPAKFPTAGFAAVTFPSRTNKAKALVASGFKNGDLINNVWSMENGSNWIEFSKENLTYGQITGASIIYYDKKLLMFGGENANARIIDNYYKESIDEGLSWRISDTTYNVIAQTIISQSNDTIIVEYDPRSQQSVILRDKEIYLIGGKKGATVYSDVWKGYLNRLYFDRQ